MKITMMGFEFNRIMQVCIPALEKKGNRRVLEHIEINCANGIGAATACDAVGLQLPTGCRCPNRRRRKTHERSQCRN